MRDGPELSPDELHRWPVKRPYWRPTSRAGRDEFPSSHPMILSFTATAPSPGSTAKLVTGAPSLNTCHIGPGWTASRPLVRTASYSFPFQNTVTLSAMAAPCGFSSHRVAIIASAGGDAGHEKALSPVTA